MLRLTALLAAAFLFSAPRAGAQGRGGDSPGAERNSVWWGSVWGGFHFGDFIVDAPSSSEWDFDAGLNLRVSVERDLATPIAVGISAAQSRLPLSYTSGSGGGCPTRCNADATISSFAAFVRYGGGRGFHQVYEFAVGATHYTNFRRTADDTRLEPRNGNTDFSIAVGGGFGYGLSRDWQLVLIQDAQYGIHERPPDVVGGSRITRTYVTRLGLRVGW
ncbi:MAG: hypothetical protein ACT4OZ_11795 [Gemmatimonadota bacterium]